MHSEKRLSGPWKLATRITPDGAEEWVALDADDVEMFRLSAHFLEATGDGKRLNATPASKANNLQEGEAAQHTARTQEDPQ
ncbi:MAG TPA: hypothetical protein VKU00_17430 [Chthonomonadaceae bacterium]|nr:hypothetical protein [Chthonomonadaceae bacterium]